MTRFVGTPLYRAPELVAGQAASRASNVWPLGRVLHELLFQRPPEWRTPAALRPSPTAGRRVATVLERGSGPLTPLRDAVDGVAHEEP
jgi:serine/threonine protein kinase